MIIKFRAWHTVNKKMFFHKDIPVLLKNAKSDNVWKYMQYIGITDKNGLEVYNGDICLHEYDGMFQVTYISELAMFKRLFQDGTCLEFARHTHKYIKVIGNIYQHDELWKQAT